MRPDGHNDGDARRHVERDSNEPAESGVSGQLQPSQCTGLMSPVDPAPTVSVWSSRLVANPPEKRRDAVENKARIIAAAHEIFAVRGIGASIPEIAARAGVGKGTVYRNFPTKADLVAELARSRIESVREAAQTALALPDAWEAVEMLTVNVLLLQEADRALGDALRHTVRPDISELRADVLACIDAVLERARAAGVVHSSATAQEFRVFISGVARELTTVEESDLDIWRRYASLIAKAFRA
jgi:AcrR family transcriptional regulator